MGALDDDRSQAPSVADENDEATTNHQHGEEEDTIDPHEEQQEICARWYQLSTFYPLARTNRDKAEGGIGIEPYDLPGGNKSHYMMA